MFEILQPMGTQKEKAKNTADLSSACQRSAEIRMELAEIYHRSIEALERSRKQLAERGFYFK
jgi:hypothetical protein